MQVGDKVIVNRDDGVCSYLHCQTGTIEETKTLKGDDRIHHVVRFNTPIERHWNCIPLETICFPEKCLSVIP